MVYISVDAYNLGILELLSVKSVSYSIIDCIDSNRVPFLTYGNEKKLEIEEINSM